MAIKRVLLPPGFPMQKLPFYLTMEEWLARSAPEGEFFFLWQVNPTVIFGRNQQIEKEVNVDYCLRKGIEFYRRKSGGGCVYADLDNIMFSYIAPSKSVETTFHGYICRVAAMLKQLGLDAEAGGRNDVMIQGRKVSGNSFYHIPGRSIVHGTMLFSTDMENMMNAITPSRSKLESKRVKSVASHITTLSEHLPQLTIERFKEFAAEYMTDDTMQLTLEDVAAIEEMSRPYYTKRWIWGSDTRERAGIETVEISKRLEGVGEFMLRIAVDSNNRIEDMDIKGDFFITGDIDNGLTAKLKGVKRDTADIETALLKTDIALIIPGLTVREFAKMMAGE